MNADSLLEVVSMLREGESLHVTRTPGSNLQTPVLLFRLANQHVHTQIMIDPFTLEHAAKPGAWLLAEFNRGLQELRS